ncbi:unnamed protein product [Orchesella dallaii]|uniref:Uncharacterized protein n=1 Tax=Orchesella dallaii TaxID=48710 RepID=A0ABP1RHQ6_9HEXA
MKEIIVILLVANIFATVFALPAASKDELKRPTREIIRESNWTPSAPLYDRAWRVKYYPVPGSFGVSNIHTSRKGYHGMYYEFPYAVPQEYYGNLYRYTHSRPSGYYGNYYDYPYSARYIGDYYGQGVGYHYRLVKVKNDDC